MQAWKAGSVKVRTNVIKILLEVESRVGSVDEQPQIMPNPIGGSEYTHAMQRDPTVKCKVVRTSSRLSHYDGKYTYQTDEPYMKSALQRLLSAAVLLFSILKYIIFGYFDPENIFSDNENI